MATIEQTVSPKILEQQWGIIKVEGIPSPFKDLKIFPGGAREWDWNETGTRHKPGIQKADTEELITNGAKVIVLSKGVYERLQVPETTRQYLEQQDIEVHIAQTEEAVNIYNRLAKEGKAVGGLFHSTC